MEQVVSREFPDIQAAYPLFINHVLKFASGMLTNCASILLIEQFTKSITLIRKRNRNFEAGFFFMREGVSLSKIGKQFANVKMRKYANVRRRKCVNVQITKCANERRHFFINYRITKSKKRDTISSPPNLRICRFTHLQIRKSQIRKS